MQNHFKGLLLKKFAIVFFISIVFTLSLHAQNFQWAKSFGGASVDGLNHMVTDSAGNIYSVSTNYTSVNFGSGAISTHGSKDALVTKHNSSGTLLWYKHIGGSMSDDGYGITLDSSGNIFVTGTFNGTVAFGPDTLTANGPDIFVAKLDATGTILWGRQAGALGSGDDHGSNIEYCVLDNSLAVCGHISGGSTFGSLSVGAVNTDDGFVAKMDANGNWLWVRDIGTGGYDNASSLVIDTYNNIVVVGNISLTAMVRKYSPSGSIIWTLNAVSPGSSYCSDITIDTAGDLYFIGECDAVITFGSITIPAPDSNGGFLVKLSPAGTTLWGRGMESTLLYTGEITADNGYLYMCGTFKGTYSTDTTIFSDLYSTASDEVFISKFDGSGTLQWMKQIGTTSTDMGYAIATHSGSIYVGGYIMGAPNPSMPSTTFTLYGGPDAFIAKISDCTPPFIQVTPGFLVNGCIGDTVHLLSTPNSPLYSYQWQYNGVNMGITDTMIDIPGNASNSGSYAVQVSQGGCSYTSHYVNVVIANPSVSLFTNLFGPGCNRDSAHIIANSLPQHTYQWLFNNSPIPGDTTNVGHAYTNGIYGVICTSPYGCVDTTYSSLITLGPHPVVTATADTAICAGASVMLHAFGANTYQWFPSSSLINPNSSSPTATPTVTTTYTVIGTASSCSDGATVLVQVNPLPQPIITYSAGILSCTGTFPSYQWYLNSSQVAGATNQTYTPQTNGNFAVEVTDSLGCTNMSDTIAVIDDVNTIQRDEQTLKIFPQPLTETSLITFPSFIEKGRIQIISATGELIFESDLENANSFALHRGQMAEGLYLVRIVSEEVNVVGRVVVE